MAVVKFFASLRETLDCAEIEIDLPENASVEDLITLLSNKNPNWHAAIQANDVLIAVNQTVCGKDTLIRNSDEIAFFPPVTGG
ncbi:molybdopterin converting factor subunit 1 [Agaribacter flavus]|uniref:Molybdopterin synthase sulfur carrier subunit n=1 Tax=Agaribacter flavus TaxID=1902781 RepID=A0ABV7FV72_9ALTE